MKTKLLLLFLISITSFSQNTYILKTDGTKILAKEGSIDKNGVKQIKYTLPGEDKIREIHYDDFDYAQDGKVILDDFLVGKKKKRMPLYVITKRDDLTLAFNWFPTTDSNGNDFYSFFKFYIFKDQELIEFGEFRDSKKDKDIEALNLCVKTIKNYFSECTSLMNKIDEALKDKPKKPLFYEGYIFKIFREHEFEECN